MAIFCGSDFSDQAAQAADVARALAARFAVPVHLVHAIQGDNLGEPSSEIESTPSGLAQERLEREAQRLRAEGASVEISLLRGIPDEELTRLAADAGARLLVLSSLGRRKAGRWLLGSTAERVSQTSAVPVLVVRDSTPFLDWIGGRRSLRVMVGVDASETSAAAVSWLRELRRAGRCDIVAAHVYSPFEEYRRLGIQVPVCPPERDANIERVLEKELAHRLADLGGEGELRFLAEPNLGFPASRLVAMAERETVDLLVVGSHQRHGASRLWQRSNSRAALHDAPMSVAIVPLPKRGHDQAEALPRALRVLVSTDFSELANRAIPYAFGLVAEGGSVCLTHVIPTLRVPNPLYSHYSPGRAATPEERARHMAELSARLRAAVPPAATAKKIEIEFEVLESDDPARAIAALAERFDADLICLGSHGRSGVVKALLGSIAEAVLRETRRPVLIVRPPKDS